MRAAVYARVSTGDQHEKNQMPDIQALIDRRGFELIRVYREKVTAWKAGHQKELAKLMKAAENKEFDCLVIWALDRLTREGPLKTLLLYKKLEDMGVTVISVGEPWTEMPHEFKEVMLSFAGWAARQEAIRQSERTKAGIARKKAGGGKVGRHKGSKDKKPRKTEGYVLRQAKEKLKRAGKLAE